MADDAKTLNAILDKLTSPGTVKGGVKAAETRAKNDWAKSKKQKELKALAEDLGKKHKMPPAVILGLMVRESDIGAALDKNGYGDGGAAFGVLQVDKQNNPVGTDDPFGADHVNQALEIWDKQFKAVNDKWGKKWPAEQVLAGAICAYNAGAKNIQTAPDSEASWRKMDNNKPNVDYSAEVWAVAAYYKANIWK
jgi:hypothetical protein